MHVQVEAKLPRCSRLVANREWTILNHVSTWNWCLNPNHSISLLCHSLVVEVGVNHCARIWQGCSQVMFKLSGHKARHIQMSLLIYFSWGWIMRKCPSCTFLAMRKASARLRLEGPTYRLPSWCSSQSLPVCKKWCVSTLIILHGQNPSLSDNHTVYTSVRVASNASFTLVQYYKRCSCEPLYTPVMLWLHIDCQ